MKNVLIFIFLIFSAITYAQIDYPRFEIDSLGQKVVVMTVQQAQKLDNNSELLLLFEGLNTKMIENDSICIKVINDKDYVISIQKLEINKLKESLSTKDEKILTLQSEIDKHNEKLFFIESQLLNRDKMIDLKDKKINNLKTKMFVGGGLSGLAIIGLVIGLIIN